MFTDLGTSRNDGSIDGANTQVCALATEAKPIYACAKLG
jgi:hypothetical protein